MTTGDRLYHIIFDNSPIGIAVINSINGKMIKVNPAFCDIVDRTEDELASIDWMAITHPDDVQEDLDLMKQLNSGVIDKFTMKKRYSNQMVL